MSSDLAHWKHPLCRGTVQGKAMMRKERVDAVETVAAKLFAVEAAIDAAIGMAAELGTVMVEARTTARLSALMGQEALEHATGSLARLVEARSKIVETHSALDQVKSELGLRAFAFGGGMQKPIGDPMLCVVEKEAA
jgi:hypothetical protein